MRILYLSCHSILEQEEVLLLNELGHQVFSPGAYINPMAPESATLRPGIPGLVYDPNLLELWNRHEAKHPTVDGKTYIHETPELMDHFDTIIVMHMPDYLIPNWSVFRNKQTIWRTIGQSVSSTESKMSSCRQDGMQIVRYSPYEEHIPGFIGQDAMIRFYKDPEIYKDWNGTQGKVMTLAQNMIERKSACNFDLFEMVTRPYRRELYGAGSDQLPWGKGKVSFETMKQAMRNNCVYFYTGTHPASYTLNFMEAWMTGIPIVAIGTRAGNSNVWPGHNLYEIPSLITNGINGFFSDNPQELRIFIEHLLYNQTEAKRISVAGRSSAISHFGKDMIKASWKEFLDR